MTRERRQTLRTYWLASLHDVERVSLPIFVPVSGRRFRLHRDNLPTLFYLIKCARAVNRVLDFGRPPLSASASLCQMERSTSSCTFTDTPTMHTGNVILGCHCQRCQRGVVGFQDRVDDWISLRGASAFESRLRIGGT